MNCREIIDKYLRDNGFDGLYHEELECGCTIDRLMLCDSCPDQCQAGHKIPCDPGEGRAYGGGRDFDIGPKKQITKESGK